MSFLSSSRPRPATDSCNPLRENRRKKPKDGRHAILVDRRGCEMAMYDKCKLPPSPTLTACVAAAMSLLETVPTRPAESSCLLQGRGSSCMAKSLFDGSVWVEQIGVASTPGAHAPCGAAAYVREVRCTPLEQSRLLGARNRCVFREGKGGPRRQSHAGFETGAGYWRHSLLAIVLLE